MISFDLAGSMKSLSKTSRISSGLTGTVSQSEAFKLRFDPTVLELRCVMARLTQQFMTLDWTAASSAFFSLLRPSFASPADRCPRNVSLLLEEP